MNHEDSVCRQIDRFSRMTGPGPRVRLILNLFVVASLVIAAIAYH